MAQIFNIIKSVDPFHLVAGAVNCDDTWMFNEVPSIGLPPSNESLMAGSVIDWGLQPRNQLSLDFPSECRLPATRTVSLLSNVLTQCVVTCLQ